jgi:hypothetical protein
MLRDEEVETLSLTASVVASFCSVDVQNILSHEGHQGWGKLITSAADLILVRHQSIDERVAEDQTKYFFPVENSLKPPALR